MTGRIGVAAHVVARARPATGARVAVVLALLVTARCANPSQTRPDAPGRRTTLDVEPPSPPWARRVDGRVLGLLSGGRSLAATSRGELARIAADLNEGEGTARYRFEHLARTGEPEPVLGVERAGDRAVALGPEGMTLWSHGEFNHCTDLGCGEAEVSKVEILTRRLSGETRWTSTVRGDEALEIQLRQGALDVLGGAVLVGDFSGTVVFGEAAGSPTVTSSGNFVARMDPRGSATWARVLHGALSNDVAVDAAGAVYVIAGAQRAAAVGDTPVRCDVGFQVGALIVKLGADGTTSWARCFGTLSIPTQAIVTSDGNLVVRGEYKDTVDFGTGPLAADGAFVASFARDGTTRWARRLGRPVPYARGMAADAHGGVVVALADHTEGAAPTKRLTDVVTLDAEGRTVATHRLEQPFPDPPPPPLRRWSDATITSVVVDDSGAIIVEGRTPTSITIDGTTLRGAADDRTAFLARLAP